MEADMRLRSYAAVFCAAAVAAAAFLVPPADASGKKDRQDTQYERQYDRQYDRPQVERSTSLDGRTTGRPRTCGYDMFQYDHRGVPYGPYCH
jgi:hypothetical protein